MAPASSLTAHLTRAFGDRYGRVSASEQRSWRNSLTALAGVVATADIDPAGVGVELKLPWNSKRIDASFVAHDIDRHPHAVLVELKQWDTAAPSQMPEMVEIGGVRRLHPSMQASLYADYLRESHSAFTEHHFRLSACSYLHNMERQASYALRGTAYAGPLREAPMFTAGDEVEMGTFLSQRLGGGDGMPLLDQLVHGGYSPSKRLLDHLGRALQESPVWVLLDEQREAFNIVRGLAERAAMTGEKAVVIVTGGPGTGKSVIAANLVVALSKSRQYKVAHATGSKAFTTNLRAVGGRGSQAVFRYFNNFLHRETPENSLDVLLCDEAHRIRETSNSRFTPRANRSEIPQVQELIRAARVSVFFLDEHQNVRLGEIGTVAAIEDGAREEGVPVERLALDTQFRCNGSAAYLSWIEALFTTRPDPVGGWAGSEYDIRVFDSPRAMELALLREAAQPAQTARMVAGFCWPWSDPTEDGTLIDDVMIGEWQRPWNEKSPEQQRPPGGAPAPQRHPYYLWATQPERIREVGCIYSAQGFEFDYCGVILGNDLVWRDDVGWVAARDASEDPSIKRRRHEPDALRALLQHTYRVLLTRGMKGTFIYSTDFDTRRKLRELVGP